MIRWLFLSAAITVLDQLTKGLVERWIPLCTAGGPCTRIEVLPFFAWTHACNAGAAFSFLAGAGGWQRWFFVAVTLLVVPLLGYEMRRLLREPFTLPRQLQLAGAAAIIGGALGNLWDRVHPGCVTDFVLVHYGAYAFPAFNVADSAISVGVAAWIVALLWPGGRTASEASRHG